MDEDNNGTVDYYTADVVSYADYYPGGMQMPGRHGSESDYEFGFNGKIKDDEIKGEGNSYDFGARMYDPRLVQFASRDPFESKFAYISPYIFAGNSPIAFIDFDGLFRLPAYQQKNNPKLTNILKNLETIVNEDPKILKTMVEITGMSEDKIQKIIKWDSGPTIKIGPLDGNIGGFTDNAGGITINENLVESLEGRRESNNKKLDANGYTALVFVVILHEAIHNIQVETDGGDKKYLIEQGKKFERKAFKMASHPARMARLIKRNEKVINKLFELTNEKTLEKKPETNSEEKK